MPEELKTEDLPDQKLVEEVTEEEEESVEIFTESELLYPFLIMMEVAVNGLSVAGDMDEGMLSTSGKLAKSRMVRKSRKIAQYVVNELYDYIFDEQRVEEEEG